MRLIQLALLAVLSWLAGLVVYLIALQIIYGESISGGDFEAVVFWSAITFLITVPLAYLPIMYATRYFLDGVSPMGVFPLAGALASVVAVILLWVLQGGLDWGGLVLALFSAESLLFSFLFAGAGVAFGLGFARVYRLDAG